MTNISERAILGHKVLESASMSQNSESCFTFLRQTLSADVLNLWSFMNIWRCFFFGFFYLSCLSLLYWLVCSLQLCDHLLVKTELLALLYVMFSSVFVFFQYLVPDQMGYTVVSIPDFCLLLVLSYILGDFHRRYYDLISKFLVGLKSLFQQGLLEPGFYGDWCIN